MSNEIHTPVLLDEVITWLKPEYSKRFIDATLGGAGHTRALLEKGASVLGIDQDKQALAFVSSILKHDRLHTAEANFMTIKIQAEKHGFQEVDGVLFDLGVSSLQFDTPDRGFSFLHNAPLDMRMSTNNPVTAAEIINNASEDELYELFMNNAQEPKSRQIAHAVVSHRPISTTGELAQLILDVYQGKRGKIHPATLTFQALRIAVNQELKILKPALKDAFALVKTGGRVAVISFHEGEDRIVKRTFSELVEAGQAQLLTKKPIVPRDSETTTNPRARSAKLRVIEKLP